MTDRVILTYENTHINDSYLVRSKKDMCEFLNAIRKECSPDMAVSARSIKSLVCEWRSHNFFYNIHIFRSRTKDVDLERHQSWWREVFCRVVSFFYFW